MRRARMVSLASFAPAVAIAFLLRITILNDATDLSTSVLVFAIASAPAYLLLLCDQSILIVRRDFAGVAIVQLIQPLLHFVFVSVGLLSGRMSVDWVVGSFGVATLAAVGVSQARTCIPLWGDSIPFRIIFHESTRFAGAQLADTALSRLDVVLAVSLIGSREAGFYAIAATICALPISLAHAIGSATFSDIAIASAEQLRRRVSGVAIRASLVAGVVGTSVLIMAIPWAIPLAFGREFNGSVVPALAGAAGSVFLVLNYVAGNGLAAQGRGPRVALAQVAGLVVDIGLLWLLGRTAHMGATGAAVASTVGYGVTCVLLLAATGITGRSLVPDVGDARNAALLLVHGRYEVAQHIH